jgi:hypothetical protein
VGLGGFGQYVQAAGTGSEDVVAVGGQAHHGGVDGIKAAAAGQQHSGEAAQPVIDR